MVKKTIYFGRFVSTPTPADLLIRSGAVLVTGEDGAGVIEDADWEVESAEEAKRKFRAEADVVVTGDEHGFFFPGFIGMVYSSELDVGEWESVWTGTCSLVVVRRGRQSSKGILSRGLLVCQRGCHTSS